MRAYGIWRTIAAVFGLLLMTLGSLLLSGYGGWPTTVGGVDLFPFPDSPKLSSLDIPISAGERTLRVTANDSLVVAFELTTSDREAVVTEVTAGKFREVPVAFVVYYLGRVTVTDGRGGSVGLNWSAPTVRRAGSQVTMAIEGRSSATNGPVQIRTV